MNKKLFLVIIFISVSAFSGNFFDNFVEYLSSKFNVGVLKDIGENCDILKIKNSEKKKDKVLVDEDEDDENIDKNEITNDNEIPNEDLHKFKNIMLIR